MKKLMVMFFALALIGGCASNKPLPPTGLEGYKPFDGPVTKMVGGDLYFRHTTMYIGGTPQPVDPETVKDMMYIFHDQNLWGVRMAKPFVPPSPLDKLEMVKDKDGIWWKILAERLVGRIKPSERPSMNGGLGNGRFLTYGSWQVKSDRLYIYWAEYTFKDKDPLIFYNVDGSACLVLK